jgi:peptide/nickel transport system ATP-binding protein
MTEIPILAVEDLVVRYRGQHRETVALNGISFVLGRERLGIVGESGSGKTTVGRALLRLLPPRTEVTARRMEFAGQDLRALDEAAMRNIRGRRISMVLQDPKFSLNPVMTVGRQIAESYRVHHKASRKEARERALAMLEELSIREPGKVFDLYPHEVSGGMGQRVMIAMMLVPEPALLIADEPTSALDVTVQAQLLSLIDALIRRRGMALMLISHNINLVASFCDRVMVMYAGRVMETCRAADLAEARHPYTRGLLACRPVVDETREELATLARDPRWLEAAEP